MQGSTMKKTFLAIMMASILPLAACGDDSDTPTAPTQPGPPVSTPAPEPTPTPPTTPTPTPQPPVVDTTVTESGTVFQPLARSGPDGLNLTFRLSDTTVVHADANTTVRDGSVETNTSAVRLGQAVTVTGVPRNGFVQATRIVITSQ